MEDTARSSRSQVVLAQATNVVYGARKAPKVAYWLAFGDALGLVLAWVSGLGLLWIIEDETWRRGLVEWWSALGQGRSLLFAALAALALLIFATRGHYTRRRPFFDEVLDILAVFVVVAVLDALVVYLAKWQFSRSWFLIAWALALLLVPLARMLAKRLLIRAGKWQKPTVIVGIGSNAAEAAEALCSEPLMGLEVVAFLSLPSEIVTAQSIALDAGKRVPVIALGDNPLDTLERLGAPQIIVALDADNLFPNQKLLQALSARYSDMSIIPPLRGLPLYGMEMTHFFSHEVLMLTVRNNLARPGPRFLKRSFDLVASIVLLIVLMPVFAYFSWRIRKSGAPAIFGHMRVGRHGRPFRCLKFRTMVPEADKVLAELLSQDDSVRAEWERDFKLRKDPRITDIGAFLRETSLDELPQLWNVLRGDMSLVGPRPIIDEELERYGDQVGYYLEAPPGMTGLWQISGRNDTGYDDRVALDCWYVRNWSLWYDIVILMKTVTVVFARKGAY